MANRHSGFGLPRDGLPPAVVSDALSHRLLQFLISGRTGDVSSACFSAVSWSASDCRCSPSLHESLASVLQHRQVGVHRNWAAGLNPSEAAFWTCPMEWRLERCRAPRTESTSLKKHIALTRDKELIELHHVLGLRGHDSNRSNFAIFRRVTAGRSRYVGLLPAAFAVQWW